MLQPKDNIVLKEVYDKCGEQFEMMGEDEVPPAIIFVLIKMVNKERELNQYYRTLLCKR